MDQDPSTIFTKLNMRFTVDVEVTVEDLPDAAIEVMAYILEPAGYPREHMRQYLKLQQTVLRALKKRPEILSQLVWVDAACEANDQIVEALETGSFPSEKEALAPLVRSLPPYERVELEEAIRQNAFSELLEIALYEGITVRATGLKGEFVDGKDEGPAQ